MSVPKIAGILLGSAAMVSAHGYVTGAVVDGQYYGGYLADSYGYMADPPKVIGWSTTVRDNGFVDGTGYATPDIICHRGAKPGAISAPIKAGGKVELQWTQWPESHKGPVLNYLAKCDGDCSTADKTSLEWFKIEAEGLFNDGTWASDALIANNNTGSVTIPSSLAAGNYVLRHEIIALHSAENKDGAQNYPQCLNLKVTGGGSDSPSGVVGTSLYKDTDPGILVNIYNNLKSYVIPGPAVYSAGDSSSSGSNAAAPATTAAATPTGTSSGASSVSASPKSSSVVSASSTPDHPKSTRLPRPSPSGRPKKHCKPKNKKKTTTSAATAAATATTTTATTAGEAAATITANVTDSIHAQTSSAADSVTVTASAGGQSAQATSAPGSSSGSASSGSSTSSGSASSGSASSGSASSGSASSGSASSSSGASSYNSQDWSSYLSSLSAEQALSVVRDTIKWLVSDQKIHARDLRV
ncbi:Polysaccharide monooxygenase [Penicillium diatomitis]|uniref:Polysaccharide monooxygenase n=1 Tax=Penicillium diatomitis TaxID=2819901 RepID=A0A9W9XF88_9EURO|nr:Polysaccharide monooxygenase [Penicillium diatomitis]KAJ5491151.1 Polysaccharide monooxygenase [Penicillium diatomitis]